MCAVSVESVVLVYAEGVVYVVGVVYGQAATPEREKIYGNLTYKLKH